MNLLNRRAAKLAILNKWKQKRSYEMTRVSKSTLDWLESRIMNEIDKLVQTHPSVGKTIRPD